MMTIFWILGIAFFMFPIVMSLIFHAGNHADSRGRRINTTWQGRQLATVPVEAATEKH